MSLKIMQTQRALLQVMLQRKLGREFCIGFHKRRPYPLPQTVTPTIRPQVAIRATYESIIRRVRPLPSLGVASGKGEAT